MEDHSVLERNEVLLHATTRINCENIMMSERRQTQGHKLYDLIYMKCPK